jgi:hypothetical protein
MAKYYPDIAKGAKGTRESSFIGSSRARSDERERDLSLSSPFLFFLNVGVFVDLF